MYDHAPERVWRHLDTRQFKTYLHARIPRVNCPVHGVRQLKVGWYEVLDLAERATRRGQRRENHRAVKKMRVDKKSFGKGLNYLMWGHKLAETNVEYIKDDCVKRVWMNILAYLAWLKESRSKPLPLMNGNPIWF